MILRVLTIDMFAVSFCSIEVIIEWIVGFFKDASVMGLSNVQMDGFDMGILRWTCITDTSLGIQSPSENGNGT